MTEVRFPDDVVSAFKAVMPKGTNPARLTLLPELLRAWGREELREHLDRKDRAALRRRDKSLSRLAEQARDLVDHCEALDRRGRFRLAVEPQMFRFGTTLENANVAAAEQWRDNSILWLKHVADIFGGPNAKTEFGVMGNRVPHRKARHYSVMIDLAAVYELVTDTPPTRRFDAKTGRDYGPFRDFASRVWLHVFGVEDRGFSTAFRLWANETSRQRKHAEKTITSAAARLSRPLSDAEQGEIFIQLCDCSPFELNLQYRHPDLWRKLIGSPA